MKGILILAGFLLSNTAWANALGSIYNGAQFNLKGWTLVQDGNTPTDFYAMPRQFRILNKVTTDPDTGAYVTVPDVHHTIRTINGIEHSVYTLRLLLDTPSAHERRMVGLRLREVAGPNARLLGGAPICGISVGAPIIAGEPQDKRAEGINLRYMVRSSDDTRCTSLVTSNTLDVEISAPLSMEPAVARELTSAMGLLTPNLSLTLPYKYKDRVVVRVNAKSIYNRMKETSGLSGAYKAVMASVSKNISEAFSQLDVTGQLQVDCQNPDPNICLGFVEQAKDSLAKILFRYTSVPAKSGDEAPLIVGTQAGSAPQFVRVDLAMDEASSATREDFVIDFSSATYSTIRTPAQVDLSNVPVNSLHPRVQSLLKDAP